MALIKCKECGKEKSDTQKKCPHCGFKEKSNIPFPNKEKKKKFVILVVIILVIIIIGVTSINKNIKKKEEKQKNLEQDRYDNLPIKIDISMTSFYGSIDYILYELNLDFDLVTAGANCYSGTQKSEFKTEKYGILHTEFRYCKSNSTQIFRVYNDENEQKLREPKIGEFPTFDKYGEKTTTKNA